MPGIENFYLLIFLFFIIALIYSMVGFGGGSSYIALLILFAVPYTIAPSISLTCNIIVTAGASLHFLKKGLVIPKLVLPFLITSIPLAWLGGRLPINQQLFLLILGLSLLLAGLKMTFLHPNKENYQGRSEAPVWYQAYVIGMIIGFVSGLVGIGGGIFLAPVMYTMKWGQPRQIAATSCVFILLNSLAGIGGQFQKGNSWQEFGSYWPLFLVVFLGGQLGSLLSTQKISQRKVEALTALLVLVVAIRLLADFYANLKYCSCP